MSRCTRRLHDRDDGNIFVGQGIVHSVNGCDGAVDGTIGVLMTVAASAIGSGSLLQRLGGGLGPLHTGFQYRFDRRCCSLGSAVISSGTVVRSG